MRGLLGLNHHDVELLFSKHAGPDVFGATMSQQRMKFLLANMTFDDPDEHAQCSGQVITLLRQGNFLRVSTRTAPNFFTLLNSSR